MPSSEPPSPAPPIPHPLHSGPGPTTPSSRASPPQASKEAPRQDAAPSAPEKTPLQAVTSSPRETKRLPERRNQRLGAGSPYHNRSPCDRPPIRLHRTEPASAQRPDRGPLTAFWESLWPDAFSLLTLPFSVFCRLFRIRVPIVGRLFSLHSIFVPLPT